MLVEIMTAIIGPFGFFTDKPMLVEIMTAVIGPIVFFTDKPMLVEIMTAIIGPFGFCTGKPMQVEQMSNDNHYWPNYVLLMAGQVQFSHYCPVESY